MFHKRLTNPALSELREELTATLEADPQNRCTVQFSTAQAYDDALLAELDALCAHYTDRIEVRFYSHEPGDGFDATQLLALPNARWLTLDCLRRLQGLQQGLNGLHQLRDFALQVEHGDFPALAAHPSLANLTRLRLSQDRGPQIDLAPLAGLTSLRRLALSVQAHNLEALAGHTGIDTLYLHRQSAKTSLAVVSQLPSLDFLSISFGSRETMPELTHGAVRNLEIIRVRGLNSLELANFPGLQALWVEDQAQLTRLDLTETPKLHSLQLSNCKSLGELSGLRDSRLRDLRLLNLPAVDLPELLTHELPSSLETLQAWSGKRGLDQQLQAIRQSRGLPVPDRPFWPA
nr:hypothetical protein [Pseudomonas sp.]